MTVLTRTADKRKPTAQPASAPLKADQASPFRGTCNLLHSMVALPSAGTHGEEVQDAAPR
eukprot:4957919-Amphidinium_carterae.2